MQLQPKLIEVSVPKRPVGAALVLHGGASRRDHMAVSPTQLSVLRMIPIARRIAYAGRGQIAVYRLLNARRGWDTTHTPVHDAHWALDRMPAIPTCLVGHSLGGRAAILTAPAPHVVAAAALAPWVYPTDVPTGLRRDQHVLMVHGDRDRIASPQRSAALAEHLSARTHVDYVLVAGGKHAMLSRHRRFDGLAAEFTVTTLLEGRWVAERSRLA